MNAVRSAHGRYGFPPLLVAALLLLFAADSMAGAVSCGCYCGKWVAPPCSDNACKKVCNYPGASTGGSSGGADYGKLIGGALGEMFREGLFGNPQQEAERQAAMEAQRQWEEQEQARFKAEQARRDEERYQRLRGALLDFNPPPQLSLQLDSPAGAGGLQLMTGDNAERGANTALAQLARAAAWSTLAAGAPTPEDAAMLADAAFQNLVGGTVNLPPPPPDVKGAPVEPFVAQVEPLTQKYFQLRPKARESTTAVMSVEERRANFEKLERQARQLEQNAREEAQRIRARAAAREAEQLRIKAEAELRATKMQFQRQQKTINDIEQGLRAVLSAMAATRKPGSYFYLGFEDGSQCLSQNAGLRCNKAQAPSTELQFCIASYRSGYTAGENIKRALLKEAHQRGERDQLAGRTYADTDSRALGACRYEYIMSYNRGHFGARPAVTNAKKKAGR